MEKTFFLRNIRYVLPVGLFLTIGSYFFDQDVDRWARNLSSCTVSLCKVVEIFCATMPHLVIWPVVFFFLWTYKKKKKAHPFLILTIAIAFSYLICFLLKGILGRARPELLFSKNIYGFFFFSKDFSYQAFPSGHATTIGAALAIVACFFPRYSLALVSLALLMAFSRVVTGAHFLSDIFAGVLLGTLFAQWVYLKFSLAWQS